MQSLGKRRAVFLLILVGLSLPCRSHAEGDVVSGAFFLGGFLAGGALVVSGISRMFGRSENSESGCAVLFAGVSTLVVVSAILQHQTIAPSSSVPGGGADPAIIRQQERDMRWEQRLHELRQNGEL